MSKDTKSPSSNFFSQWLEKLQQESWQLELLISGFALFGIYNSHGLILDFKIGQIGTSTAGRADEFLAFIWTVMYIGWRIFFINLLIHVILRALWIGAIGLRYVSNEIEYDQLGYTSYFENYLRENIGSYDSFIENLEKICSVLFSFTFLLFLFFISAVIFVFIGTIPESIMISADLWDHWTEYIFMAITIIYFVLGIIVFIDFISLGGIRKIDDPTVEKFYAPIYKFYGFITLSFLYRPLLYNFLDNKYTKRLFFVSFPYFLILVIYPYLFESNIHPHLVEDDQLVREGLLIQKAWYSDLLNESLVGKNENESKQIKYDNREQIVLSSYTLQPDALSFFMRIYENDRTMLSKKYKITQVFKEGWRFALFGDNANEDSIKTGIRDRYTDRYLDLRKEYNVFRDQSKDAILDDSLRASKLSAMQDSINILVDSLQEEKTEELHQYIINRNKKTLQSLQGLIKVKIDSVDYTEHLVCKHAYHPHFDERGLHCDLLNLNMPSGAQTLKFERGSYSSRQKDSIHWSVYQLPVIIKEIKDD